MKTTRRAFVGAAGALSAWTVAHLGAPAAAAQPTATQTAPDAGIRADAGTRPDAGLTPQPPGTVAQVARERYGKFLDEKQLKMLDAKLADIETRGKRLHAVKLANGDEPACDFSAVRL